MKDISNYSLKAHNTFGIDSRCRRFVEFGSVEEAREAARILREDGGRYIIIGGGSNLLLTGSDTDAIVVRSAIRGFSQEGCLLTVGSGETWDSVVDYCIAHELYGAENLSHIPGDAGASAVQNIGAYGVEVKDLIDSIEAVEIATGRRIVISGGDCGYAYRHSKFKKEWKDRFLITRVAYRLKSTFEPNLNYGNIRAELDRQGIDKPTARQLRDTIIAIRSEKLPDPAVEGNAGSFFMNPVVSRAQYEALAARHDAMPHYDVDAAHVKIPAGWLIEQCGWKGRTMGRAGVHSRQALVLVNKGGATGQEIVALCNAIRSDVSQRFGINIQPEVNII